MQSQSTPLRDRELLSLAQAQAIALRKNPDVLQAELEVRRTVRILKR